LETHAGPGDKRRREGKRLRKVFHNIRSHWTGLFGVEQKSLGKK